MVSKLEGIEITVEGQLNRSDETLGKPISQEVLIQSLETSMELLSSKYDTILMTVTEQSTMIGEQKNLS